MVLPEKLTCIAIDRDSNYCAGGTALGRIYLWEASTAFPVLMSADTVFSRLLPEYSLTFGMPTIARYLCCVSLKMAPLSSPVAMIRGYPYGPFLGMFPDNHDYF